MSVMTYAQGVRSLSTYVSQATPTKPYGNNPYVLVVSNIPAKEVRTYIAMPISAAILAPTTHIVSATLRIYSKGPWSHAHGMYVYRVTGGANWSKMLWPGPDVASGPVSATKTSAADKTVWEFDVLSHIVGMQTAGNRGWRIAINGATEDIHYLYNSGAFTAQLFIEYHVKPPAPTSLSPANGQVVSIPKPGIHLLAPQATHTAIKIQISATQNGTTPDWEKTHSDAGTQFIDLSAEVGAPALSPGDSTYYRMKFVGTGGQEGDWSSWTEYTYVPFGAATLVEPPVSPGNVVYDPSPPIIWSFADQAAYRLIITDPSAGVRLYDSGIVSSDDQGASPSKAVCSIPGHTYRATVYLWDDLNRVSNGGATDFVQLSRDFTFQLDPTVDPVTNLVATDMSPNPFVTLGWQRTTPADYYQVIRDNEQVAYLPAAEALVSGDYYEWVDTLASPRRPHTWRVRAVVNNKTASANPSVSLTIEPGGLWLSQPEEGRYLPIMSLSSQSVGYTEDGDTFTPLNSQYGVRVSGSKRGMSGTITGEILATELTDNFTGASLRDLFLEMRAEKSVPMILTLLDRNIKIIPFNMTVAPTPTMGRNEDYVYACSFEFIEVP